MINVDPLEIEKFNQLAHRWWDPHGEFKPLHDLNPLRLGLIEEAAGGLAGKRVLDVGCGGGILAESMAARGAQVTGIDVGEKPLKVAQLHLLETGHQVDYRRASVEQLATEVQDCYDVVTCMEMLEHVPDPASTVKACAAVTKPGGLVVFSTINRNLKSFLFAIVGAEYVLGLLPRGTHEYARFIRPAELARMGRDAGLNILKFVGMTYNPFTKVYALSSDTDVNYIAVARRA
ncbi:bifunctional 2-polyprenyl-6-hydroxyphenol methylase/3-demethylubiquinol 3-O-methyltransferase UbiG [Pelomicrobium methylotrophicum]|uniref:Ubiquinone biosynthesis O-methyltransferase n=1 Tax=Pelomicrobium methylotrophicum TaxID=2602750 RepID=A0A5C7ELL9_9PROT|nr:bifunctional 2-polyprenyl-6-hydroxyphenol methylase/3-demethylubiquinol 3-O-methyltransferase UbiG [Pelomicrobium methylotrophicum]TXF12436.1 bifunctional 2-polyprenyl-6-hydroxyphenol methylase/3-demethylubiquinol 3-O-methyltransferase UbiG [Pelomicrobium methylotrophicum]